MGIGPSEITSVTQLRQREGHALYRIVCCGKSYILKWFVPGADNVEVRAYGLLSRYGVPTIPVHGSADNILLLEDLDTSPTWRLATEEDNSRAETGIAVAEWYRVFHSAGWALLSNPQDVPSFLHRESDVLDALTILRMGEQLGLADKRVWRLAAEHIEPLKHAMRAQPATLNYNDFEWTNLALSREVTLELRGIVFDYHLLGIGPIYSDYRNVISSLEGPAREAFQEAFGPVDEYEAILDAPVSVLYSLHEALGRLQFPGWAIDLLDEAASGELELKLRRAISILE